MYIKEALFCAHPIRIIPKRRNADILEIRILGKPLLRPEESGIIISAPRLPRAPPQTMYKNEINHGLRGRIQYSQPQCTPDILIIFCGWYVRGKGERL